jgi:hypothetical protein
LVDLEPYELTPIILRHATSTEARRHDCVLVLPLVRHLGGLSDGMIDNGKNADHTAKKQRIGRPFEPGKSGNPAGRPKGARSKLSEAFLQAFADDFERYGKEVIQQVRTERPHDYLKVIATVTPRRMEIEDATPMRPASELTDDELAGIIQGANGSGKTHRAGRMFD